jgi:hypothetical protein
LSDLNRFSFDFSRLLTLGSAKASSEIFINVTDRPFTARYSAKTCNQSLMSIVTNLPVFPVNQDGYKCVVMTRMLENIS